MAYIDDPRILQPFDASPVILEPGSLRHLGDLELAVLPGKLRGDPVKDICDPRLIQPFRILPDILFIIRDQLPLKFQCALECIPLYILPHHTGHTAQYAIIKKQIPAHRQRKFPERLSLRHVCKKIIGQIISVTFRPEELFKIQRVHLIIRLISDTVALNPSVADPQERPAADHIITAVKLKKLKRSRNIREILYFIKNNERLSLRKAFGRVDPGNVLHNVLRLITIFQNHFVFRFFHKININNLPVILPPEMPD